MQSEKAVSPNGQFLKRGMHGGVFALAWTERIKPEFGIIGKKMTGKGTGCHAMCDGG
jgi:hypothetical protein